MFAFNYFGNLPNKRQKMNNHFTLRLAAILLMTTGYGWAGGHFIPTDAPFWAYLPPAPTPATTAHP
jgi:hypothetical protein